MSEKKIIETVDENGNTINFELFDIIEFEEKEYALLINPEEEDPENIIIMKLLQDNDGYTFETIEDDEEFEKVTDYLESLGEDEE